MTGRQSLKNLEQTTLMHTVLAALIKVNNHSLCCFARDDDDVAIAAATACSLKWPFVAHLDWTWTIN